MTYYVADDNYVAIKAETTEGTAVIPDTFLPVESHDLATAMNFAADRRIQGIAWETNSLSPGQRQQAGNIKFWGDPTTIGYVLDMFLKLGSSSGSAGDGYTHPFTAEDPQSYTVEVSKGPYAQRFFGVKGDELELMFEDDKLKANMSLQAMGQVSVMSLLSAVTDNVSNALDFNQDYDLEPTKGLVAGDQLVIDQGLGTQETVTIASVDANGYGVALTGTVTESHAQNAVVYLKKQTASFATLPAPLRFGDLFAGFSTTAALALTAAGSRTTSTPIHEWSLTFSNNLLAAPTSQGRDPQKLLPQVRSCVVTIKQLFATPVQRQKWLEQIKQGLAFIIYGKVINATTPTRNKLTIELHNALLETNEEPMNVGEYIMYEQTFRAAYDSSDAKAITVELVNTKASY